MRSISLIVPFEKWEGIDYKSFNNLVVCLKKINYQACELFIFIKSPIFYPKSLSCLQHSAHWI